MTTLEIHDVFERDRSNLGRCRAILQKSCEVLLVSTTVLFGLLSAAQAMPGPGAAGPKDPTVTESTGSANFEISIKVPPGPGGLVPSLTLAYSSRRGDGPYGVGWELGLGEIRCSSRFGVPSYAYSECDRFELDGMLLTRDGATDSYHAFVEKFQQIDYDPTTRIWTVVEPDGMIRRYGARADSRIMSGIDVARWLLSEIEDAFGNVIFITYDDTTDIGTRYPILLTYGAGATPQSGQRSIELAFGEDRPDPIRDYAGGVERQVTKRLTDIKVLSYGAIVRRYGFGYSLPNVNYTTNRTRLSWVQEFGSDCFGALSQCQGLPRQEYEYTDSTDDGTTARFSKFGKGFDRPDDYRVHLQGSLFGRAVGVRIADVNGDGLPDVIEGGFPNGFRNENLAGADPADTIKVKLNTGAGFAEDPAWTAAFRGLEVERPRADFVQMGPNGMDVDVLHFLTAGGIIDDPSAPVQYSTVEHPVDAAWPAGMSRPDARYSLDGDSGLSSGMPTPGWIEGMGRLFFTDVDADGLADIVMSVRLSGVDRVLNPDGTPIASGNVERTPGLAVRKVYRNSGDASIGWLEDEALAVGLPPFGLVQFESAYAAEMKMPFGLGPDPSNIFSQWPLGSGIYGGYSVIKTQDRMDPCSVRGLYGHFNPLVDSPDVCANFVNLAPRFEDFDGDGFLDLMVLELADNEALYQGPYNVNGGNNIANLPPDNKARSRVWIQDPNAGAGQDRWIRAEEFDLPNVPFRSPSNGGFWPLSSDDWFLFAHSQTFHSGGSNPRPGCTVSGLFGSDPWLVCAPLSSNVDSGVRLVDLNRDGLTDVIWSLYQYDGPTNPSYGAYPSIAQGVLLNTGTGWCSSNPEMAIYVDSECAHAAIYYPPSNAYPTAPWEPSGLGFYRNGNPVPASGHLADLNADGFLDYLQVHITKDHPGNKAWIFDPAGAAEQPYAMWVRDDRYDLNIDYAHIGEYWNPDFLGLAVVDVNGDGAADVIGDDLKNGSGNQLPQTFVSGAKHGDLLRLVRNGMGGQISITYASAIIHRDAEGARPPGAVDLEAMAIQHASATGEGLDGTSIEDVVRWSTSPVVAEVRTAAPNRAADPADPTSTFGPPTRYRYAHPRFCVKSQSDLGFRLVERTRPAGDVVTSSYFQMHGRAGETSSVVVSEGGIELHRYEEDWEIQPDVPGFVPGSIDHPEVHVGRIAEARSWNVYGGGAPGARRTQTLHYDDDYGYNFISKSVLNRPTTTLVNWRVPISDPSSGIFGLVAEQKVFDDDSATLNSLSFLKHTKVAYDRGRVIIRDEMVKARGEPGAGTVESHLADYDAFGNLIRETVASPNGDQVTHFCYDGDSLLGGGVCPEDGQNSHSVRVGILDSAGGVVLGRPDPGTGAIIETSSSYSDEPSTQIGLDVFGRPIESFISGNVGSWVRTSKTVYADIQSEPSTVSRFAFPAATSTGAEAIWNSVVLDGFGGVWKEVSETPTGYVGRMTFHDSARRSVRESLPLSCADESCSSALGETEPLAILTELDAVGRATRRDTPDGFSIFEYSFVPSTSIAGPWAATSNAFDSILEKNGKGDVIGRLMDGDRVARVDECESTVSATALTVGSCGGAQVSSTYYAYEATGEMNAIFDARAVSPFDDPQHALVYEYDTLGRIVQIKDPALSGTGSLFTTYDRYGNVDQLTNGRGQARNHSYDELNRLVGIATPIEETNYTLTYREGEKKSSGDSSDAYGRSVTFDDLGRLHEEHFWAKDTKGHYYESFFTAYSYDLLGRVTDVVHPARHLEAGDWVDTTVRYEYDGAFIDQICDLGNASDCSSSTSKVLKSVGYDSLGRRTSMELPGGVRSFAYDVAHRLLQDDFSSPDYQYTRSYTAYDGMGNILSIGGSESALPPLDMSEAYTYDERNRIKAWTKEGTQQDFDYDDLGNLTLKGGNVQFFDDPTRVHAITRRELTESTPTIYKYDSDGNVASIRGASKAQYFDFDSSNKMLCIRNTSSSRCAIRVAYDVYGKRVVEYVDGEKGINVYVGEAFLFEDRPAFDRANVEVALDGERIALKRFEPELRNSSASVFPIRIQPGWPAAGAGCAILLLVFWGAKSGTFILVRSRPMRAATALTAAWSLLVPSIVNAGARSKAAPPSYYWEISDPLGSGLIMINESGQRVRHQSFTPFGEVYDEVGAGLRTVYAGHRRNEESGLYHMQARWYDAAAGRFLSVDPLVRSAAEPQSVNAYSYMENNPLNGVDSTGMSPDWQGSSGRPGGGGHFGSFDSQENRNRTARNKVRIDRKAKELGLEPEQVIKVAELLLAGISVSTLQTVVDPPSLTTGLSLGFDLTSFTSESVAPTAEDAEAAGELILLLDEIPQITLMSERSERLVAESASDGSSGAAKGLAIIVASELTILRNSSLQNTLRDRLGLPRLNRNRFRMLGDHDSLRAPGVSRNLTALKQEIAIVRRRGGLD